MLQKIAKLLILVQSIILVLSINNTIKQSINHRRENAYERISIDYTIDKILGTPREVNSSKVDEEKIIDYKMILEIPSIGLKKGILDKSDEDNNIEKNVTILNGSVYPDQSGNVYIAAHSGNGAQSYFNDLVKLKLGDLANIYYGDKKYTYAVEKIGEINKNGMVSIVTDQQDNLILITCSQKNKDKYLVITLSRKQN